MSDNVLMLGASLVCTLSSKFKLFLNKLNARNSF